jgi:hypothetical protein
LRVSQSILSPVCCEGLQLPRKRGKEPQDTNKSAKMVVTADGPVRGDDPPSAATPQIDEMKRTKMLDKIKRFVEERGYPSFPLPEMLSSNLVRFRLFRLGLQLTDLRCAAADARGWFVSQKTLKHKT